MPQNPRLITNKEDARDENSGLWIAELTTGETVYFDVPQEFPAEQAQQALEALVRKSDFEGEIETLHAT